MQASDEKQLEFAMSEARILVTHDEDFLKLAKQGTEHSGIAYCHPQLRSIGQVLSA
jgi:predicted nuclease of predicted toxin-antitoxin system